jgi:hypothetical protein
MVLKKQPDFIPFKILFTFGRFLELIIWKMRNTENSLAYNVDFAKGKEEINPILHLQRHCSQ